LSALFLKTTGHSLPALTPPYPGPSIIFFEKGFSVGKDIVFPHGPLAFLMYPLAQNILIATLATALLKIFLVFNIYQVLENKGNYRWLIAFMLAYFMAFHVIFQRKQGLLFAQRHSTASL
jgi:hypothetical protein